MNERHKTQEYNAIQQYYESLHLKIWHIYNQTDFTVLSPYTSDF